MTTKLTEYMVAMAVSLIVVDIVLLLTGGDGGPSTVVVALLLGATLRYWHNQRAAARARYVEQLEQQP